MPSPRGPYNRPLSIYITAEGHAALTKIVRHMEDLGGFGRCKQGVVDVLLRLAADDPEIIEKITLTLPKKSVPEDS